MKPAVFDFAAPGSVADALGLLADDAHEVKVLAGGQSLVPMLNMRLARPELLVDITRIDELTRLFVDPHGALHIGAAVRQAAVSDSAEVKAGWPLLTDAIRQIGHPQIRNRGTVCGSLAHHDPAAELPAVATALEAEFVIASRRGQRHVPAAEFFVGTFQTALDPDELLLEVVFPPAPGWGWAFRELARRRGDFATIGVAVRVRSAADVVDAARVVFCGAGDGPVRLPEIEDALTGHRFSDAAVAQASASARSLLDPPGDVHASATYRKDGAAVLLDRGLREAWERCHDR